jgi:hypothetical protein
MLRNHKSVCEHTLSYRIGIFDDRFGISEREFRESIKRAENIWENAMGLNLFEYNPAAKFAINLIFDERQKATLEKQRLNKKLKQMESLHTDISKSYKYWNNIYEEKVRSYKKSVSSYEERVKEYNDEVEYWNRNREPSKKIYEDLERERENINRTKLQLDEERSYINGIVDMMVSMKNRVNIISDIYKAHVETYNSYYGGYRRFNQGEYNGKEITLYQFNDSAGP